VTGLTTPAVGHAQAPAGDRIALVESGLADAPSWWGLPGLAGAIPDANWGVAFPWSLAGLVRGAWTLDEADAAARPFPGVAQARSPLGWYDSLAVTTGSDGAWDGFAAGLAKARLTRARLTPDAGGRVRALGDLVLGSGAGGYDENGLWLRRGDSLSSMEGGAEGWKLDGIGPYGPAGRHQYGGGGLWSHDRVRVEGAFTQRGAAASLLGGEEQSAGSASGWGGVGYGAGRQ